MPEFSQGDRVKGADGREYTFQHYEIPMDRRAVCVDDFELPYALAVSELTLVPPPGPVVMTILNTLLADQPAALIYGGRELAEKIVKALADAGFDITGRAP